MGKAEGIGGGARCSPLITPPPASLDFLARQGLLLEATLEQRQQKPLAPIHRVPGSACQALGVASWPN